jgi:nucleoside-diphosphate-sugar epimerase
MDIGRVLVTGSSGFIGGRLIEALRRDGVRVVGMRRSAPAAPDRDCVVADLRDRAGLEQACAGIDAVVHCAGHAHAFGREAEAADRHHHDINYLGTRNLVEAAGRAGVRRFVFLSSVKAMGSPGARCVDESWPAPPDTAYGRAKRAAEEAVLDAGRRHGMGVTNLRLAMVYGRGSRGNLERMARAIRAGWFPPLPETGARRSLVHVADVVDAIRSVLADARAGGRTWIVADTETYSGAQLYDAVRALLGKGPASWRVPAPLLRAAAAGGDRLARLLGRPLPRGRDAVERLLGSECYRPDAIRRELGWQARIALDAGLREMLGLDARAAAAAAAGGSS